KITLWADGLIYSVTYDKYFNWYNSANVDAVLADIQRHTGTVITSPQQTTSQAYKPIVDFLTKQLAFQQQALQDNSSIPLAESTIQEEISRTSLALNYYKSLQK